MRGILALVAAAGLVIIGSGCDLLAASEITVDARNEAAEPMVVQVISGMHAEAPAFGPEHTLAPGEERQLELAVPGGDWTVTVNGAHLLSSSDAAGRRGRLPVTLVLPDPEVLPVGPVWEAPGDWANPEP